jgi:pentatricopeptide repeat protein
MIQLHADGTLNLPPNAVSYNSIIDAFAKQGMPQDAGRMLRRMQEDNTTGLSKALSTAISYNSTINAFATVGNSAKAEALLEEMHKDYLGRNTSAKPSIVTFGSLLKAYSLCDSPDAGQKADTDLTLLEKLGLCPTAFFFFYAKQCWMKYMNCCWRLGPRATSSRTLHGAFQSTTRPHTQPRACSR